MEIDFVKLIAQGGFAVGSLVALAYVVKKIGERMIASIDRLTERSDANQQKMAEAFRAMVDETRAVGAAMVAEAAELASRVSRVEAVLSVPREEYTSAHPTPVSGVHQPAPARASTQPTHRAGPPKGVLLSQPYHLRKPGGGE